MFPKIYFRCNLKYFEIFFSKKHPFGKTTLSDDLNEVFFSSFTKKQPQEKFEILVPNHGLTPLKKFKIFRL